MEIKEIKSIEDLATHLEDIKTGLETKAKADAKAEVTEQLKAVTDELAELKKLKPGTTAEELKAVKDAFEVKYKALEMYIDQMQIKVKSISNNTGKIITPSFASAFSESMTEQTDNFLKMSKEKKGKVDFQLKAVTDMSFGTNFPTAGASVTFVRPGIIELPKRKLHIRELLPGGGMGQMSSFDFVKEIAGDGQIGTVQEAAQKPQIDLNLQEVSLKAQWIAGFLRISRNMLDDVIGMTTFLQSRLPELLLRQEDAQILFGNGTGSNLSGILNTGNYTAATTAATVLVEQLVDSIAQLEEYDREANGILMGVHDFYNIYKTKSTAGVYSLPGNNMPGNAIGQFVTAENGNLWIAGVPVYRSTAMISGTAIVGDWNMGANFITREPARLEFFYEDGTNVQTNQVTVRIEERVVLAIYCNNYFIKVTTPGS